MKSINVRIIILLISVIFVSAYMYYDLFTRVSELENKVHNLKGSINSLKNDIDDYYIFKTKITQEIQRVDMKFYYKY